MTSYPPVSSKAPYLLHGGDYNPEQWPRATWAEDFKLMQQAGMTSATVGVFSWVSLQPAEDQFTFDWLDEVMDGLYSHGIHAVLATPSAAQPAWISQAYPDVLPVDANGVRRHHGRRVNYCPNSPSYRRFSAAIAQKLAERFKNHPALMLWHISNEYGATCYCDTCAAKFREFLQAKYKTLDELNHRWWTRFWGHTYTDWSQIEPPFANGETSIHGQTLDYRRFMSHSNLECFINERDVIRPITPEIPITTNLMGAFKPLDYRLWAKEMDVISWDCYPLPTADASDIAFMHDLNRGLKDGKPFLLMEQTPSSQNWQAVNALKRPGVLRLWSYLAVAHGADSVMYFQWRRGRGSWEKLHTAVVEHSGRDNTRVFKEVSQIGKELMALGGNVVGAGTDAKVALLFDWDNWWALDEASGPIADKKYIATIQKHYRAFFRKNIPVDMVFPDSDFSKYEVLIAPMMYMVKAGVADKIQQMVKRGGSFVTTYFSGVVDETDLAFEIGYPGPLHDVLGIHVEEIDALFPDKGNTIVMADRSGAYECNHLADLVVMGGATVLATFGSDFYRGRTALTEHPFGNGKGYFIASDPNDQFLSDFYGRIAADHDLHAPLFPDLHAPAGVEVTVREKNGNPVIFILNHNAQPVKVTLDGRTYTDLLNSEKISERVELDGYGVRILTPRP